MTEPVLLTRRAVLNAATTYDPGANTVEVTFTAGGTARRFDERGAYLEELDPTAFVLAANAPVLDGHARSSMADVLGAVVSASPGTTEGKATLRLSRHHDIARRIASDLKDGARFAISPGYTVERWMERTSPKGERIKRATAWTVHEISFVPLPADAGASTRESPMTTEAETQDPPATEQILNRAGVNAVIRSLATSLSLPATWSDAQIDAGASEEQARAAALNEMLARGAQNVPTARASVGTDYTDPALRARAMGEGLYTRINRAHNPSEQARAYAQMGIQDLARDCLNVRGLRTCGSSADIIKRALHSTSDFPLLLGDAVGRTLRDGYTIAGSALKPLGRQSNLTDFRTRHRLQLSDGPELEPLNEAGEIKAGSLTESKESYALTTYAKRIGITRQILVNDDLGAFADIGRRLGQGAAATEGKLLAELLVSNPKMADGKAVFHADHGNLATTGAALSIDSLSAARLAMRRQKSLTGQPIQVAPKYLIIPPELETSAEKILHEITAAMVADVNPFSKSLTPVVEPRLTNATAWYLASDTGQIDGFEWAYLDSEEGPQLDTRAGWEIEGVEVKCRLDFGAGWVEHRGWYKNAGA